MKVSFQTNGFRAPGGVAPPPGVNDAADDRLLDELLSIFMVPDDFGRQVDISYDSSSSGDQGDASSTYSNSTVRITTTSPSLDAMAKERRSLEMRRKRNRESMYRLRQRKKLADSKLQELAKGLEMRLQRLKIRQQQQGQRPWPPSALARAGIDLLNAPTNALELLSQGNDGGLNYRQMMEEMLVELQQVEQKMRSENAHLAQEIYKHEQAFHALREVIAELREAERLTPVPQEYDPVAWVNEISHYMPHLYSSDVFQLMATSMQEVLGTLTTVNKMPESKYDIFGWRVKREINNTWIDFMFSKDFVHMDIDTVARKTWAVQSHATDVQETMGRMHFMKVLRAVNDHTLLCARNLFFPNDYTNYIMIYVLMLVKTSQGWIIAQRSLMPEDGVNVQAILGPNFSYVNAFYGMVLTRLKTTNTDGSKTISPTGCNATYGGRMGDGTKHYTDVVGPENFFAMLRWESACVGPLLGR
uniref:BZIP domain-containing protein n=1 Tax=Globisporangium ultimum (strain ATCC 200006 / CBS 805.95 / DAOM BR144) TaxID=431595 RepID=K3WXF8_GLOUD